MQQQRTVGPIDYSSRVAYRPPPRWYRRFQWLGVLLTSLGLAPHQASTLVVRGRTSGKIRRTPVVVLHHAGARYLVSLAGESQWVRNVRAANGAARIRRRTAESVHLVELGVDERPAAIEAYVRGTDLGDRTVRAYFGLDPTLADLTEVAPFYPVFRVEASSKRQAAPAE